MNTVRNLIRLGLLTLFGLCATDGICQAKGIRFMGAVVQNLAVGLFFLLAAAALTLAWREKDRRALGRLRLWSALVLLLGVGLLVALWLVLLVEFPAFWVDTVLYGLAVVTAPVPSCTVMFWPIFGWTLLLVVSWKMCRMLDWGSAHSGK